MNLSRLEGIVEESSSTWGADKLDAAALVIGSQDEQAVAAESTSIRVLRSKRMDVSDVGPAWADANFWVVVVEWIDPDRPDPLPQQDDPEGETEASFRRDHARGFEHAIAKSRGRPPQSNHPYRRLASPRCPPPPPTRAWSCCARSYSTPCANRSRSTWQAPQILGGGFTYLDRLYGAAVPWLDDRPAPPLTMKYQAPPHGGTAIASG